MALDIAKNVVATVGGVLGALAFFWKVIESLLAHVRLDLTVEDSSGRMTAATSIENSGGLFKKIHYSVLLIGPEDHSLVQIAGRVLTTAGMPHGASRGVIAALAQARIAKPLFALDRSSGLVPIPFYYEEQSTIGRENIKHRATIDTGSLQDQGYRVVFCIFVRYLLGIIRWRATVDLMKVG